MAVAAPAAAGAAAAGGGGFGVGSLLGAGAAGLGFSSLVGGLFGSKNKGKLNQNQLAQLRGSIKAGGLQSGLFDENRQVGVSASPERQALVAGLANVFRTQAGELGELRGLVRPGFGALTQAARRNIESAERQAVGELRGNLARRRVLGSNFAAGQETAIREQFGRAQAETEATAFLSELGLNLEILQQESAARLASFQTQLDEMNLQATTALQILNASGGAVASASTAARQLQQQFLSDVLGAGVGSAIRLGGGIGQLFRSGPGSAQTFRNQPVGGSVPFFPGVGRA